MLKLLFNNQTIRNTNIYLKKSIITTSIKLNNQPILNISDTCVQKLKTINKPNTHLRISIDSGGCSGFEYKFSLDDKITSEDTFIEKDNIKIIIDKASIDYVKGSTLDYIQELIKSGFRITKNPNAEHGCSCGASFTIKI